MDGMTRPALTPARLVLVSDLWRGLIGLGITTVVTVAGSVVLAPVGVELGISVAGTTWSGVFGGWAVLAAVQTILVLAVFAPMAPRRMRVALRLTTPRTRSRRIVWNLFGGGGTYWATTGAVIAIATLAVLVVNRVYVRDPILLYLGIAVVVTSLALIITSYAVRYAREQASAGGIGLRGDQRLPPFSDHLYLAIQLATTFSASDVELSTPAARRIVSLNSLVAFAFNSVVVALLVSVLVNAVS
jgi:hypothetical protein